MVQPFEISRRIPSPWLAVIAVSIAGTGASAEKIPVTSPTPKPTEIAAPVTAAGSLGHVVIGRHKYRLTRDVSYRTRHFGKIVLETGFESDGSTSPIPDVTGSLYAGFLHDALYRGSPYLHFVEKTPRSWTKRQADDEYCYQLRRLGVPAKHRRINCTAIRLILPFASPWDFRKIQRENNWAVRNGTSLQ